jgi:hypothetical protein
VRKKEEAAKKAAERKARIEREKAAAASGSPAPGPAAPSRTFRSSRIAQKEAKEAEERARAKAEERLKYSATPDRSTSTAAVEAKPESEVDIKIAERDRRAARAREREEAKKAREEAELLAALQESEGGPAEEVKAEAAEMQMDLPQATAPMDVSIPISDAGETSAFALEGGQSSYGTYLAVPLAPSAVTQIPPAPVVSAPGNPAMLSQTAVAETEVPVPAPEPEYVVESEDYFLDCSVCKKRGLNLDPNSRLVACDVCDRWEHVVCHRKQDEKEGRPKRDWENDPFLCEDCEGLETSVILPSAPKRERSDKQKAGAKKGAEKRKAKAAAERAKKAAAKAAADPQPKPVKSTTFVPKAPQSQASPVAVPVMNGSNSQTHSVPPLPAQQQQQQLHRASHPSHPSPTLQVMQPHQAGAAFQQVPQPSRSPYNPGTPSHSPYAAIQSPSLQPQMQAQGQQYPSAAYQQPGHFQGQPVPQNIQMHHAGQSLPSARYMPQPPPAPQYVGHQQGYPSNGANFQGGFAAQNAYPGAPSPQMYSQQGIQNAYRSGGPPMQSSHQPPQSNYQPGYPSYPYNSGPPTPSFAPQQQVQHNVYPGQHQMPQQQGRPSSSDHV